MLLDVLSVLFGWDGPNMSHYIEWLVCTERHLYGMTTWAIYYGVYFYGVAT